MKKILIANRGEIVCRIARTAQRLGIATAGVYADPDRTSPHILSVDEAVPIGPSYLAIDKVIEAAKRVGADAIHPGYGFLAENAHFAEACAAAGLAFIGPAPDAIRKMGSKANGRAIAAACGVPIVPGYEGPDLAAGAEALGYPLMIKASAGGGGRGMRLVTDSSQFATAVESAEREARAAFGDGTLILERAIANAHHVEVQIFGDTHGNLIHLFERDCSMQRRHQKFIEESPSPAVNDVTREKLFEAAIGIAKAVNYVNAGTVEFLVEPNGAFYFIEVNTRIQVEHAVTEMVTGLDLIEMQIRVAEGRSLEDFPVLVGRNLLNEERPFVETPFGFALEVRLCAEDPAADFAPFTGRLALCDLAADRIDTGFEAGSQVTPHYDSLLAKLLVHRFKRADAIDAMIDCLRAVHVLGVQTNRDYLIQVLDSDEYRHGRASTAFLPAPAQPDLKLIELSAHALALWIVERDIANRPILPKVRAFRNNPWRKLPIRLRTNGRVFDIQPEGLAIRLNDDWQPPPRHIRPFHMPNLGGGYWAFNPPRPLTSIDPATPRGSMLADIDGVTRTYSIASSGASYWIASPLGSFHFERLPRHPKPKSTGAAAASSPMPGQVLRILVERGEFVKVGTPLVILEAMKMEQTIKSQMDGRVNAILVKPGDVVAPGQTLVQIGESPQ